jgi:hypothetical protein
MATVPGGDGAAAVTGIPSEPSALAVLESLPGPVASDAGVGEDPSFVSDTVGEQLPSADIQVAAPDLADAPAVEPVAPTEAPLTVTVEVGSAFVPADSPVRAGTAPEQAARPGPQDAEEAAAPLAAPDTADRMPTPPANSPASADDPRDAAFDPEIGERLRRLSPDRQTEQRAADDLPSSCPAPDPVGKESDAAVPTRNQDGEQPQPGTGAGEMPAAPDDPWTSLRLEAPAAVGPEGDGRPAGAAGADRPAEPEAAAGQMLPQGWEWPPALLAVLAARSLTAVAGGPAAADGAAPDPDHKRPRRR